MADRMTSTPAHAYSRQRRDLHGVPEKWFSARPRPQLVGCEGVGSVTRTTGGPQVYLQFVEALPRAAPVLEALCAHNIGNGQRHRERRIGRSITLYTHSRAEARLYQRHREVRCSILIQLYSRTRGGLS